MLYRALCIKGDSRLRNDNGPHDLHLLAGFSTTDPQCLAVQPCMNIQRISVARYLRSQVPRLQEGRLFDAGKAPKELRYKSISQPLGTCRSLILAPRAPEQSGESTQNYYVPTYGLPMDSIHV